jgi:hypothetical protein
VLNDICVWLVVINLEGADDDDAEIFIYKDMYRVEHAIT